MVRISKQEERRNRCPRRCKPPAPKTGTRKDNLPSGYREHANAVDATESLFIPKIR